MGFAAHKNSFEGPLVQQNESFVGVENESFVGVAGVELLGRLLVAENGICSRRSHRFVMEKLLKRITGFLFTAGLIIFCPLPNMAPLSRSTVVSDQSEQAALKSVSSNHASATESLHLSDDLNRLPYVSLVDQRIVEAEVSTVLSLLAPGKEEASPYAANPFNEKDSSQFEQIMQNARSRSLHNRPMGEIVQALAQQLLGSPYEANLLDRSSKETLVVSLTRFDCVLFVETVLALARGIAIQDYSYPTFAHHLQNHRYRDGRLDGYCSRLHYFSEWIADNQRRGNVLNIAAEIGGVPFPKTLNFMSTHRSSYPRLVNDATYRCVQQMESSLNPLTLYYIPQSQIRQYYAQLQPGDIVAIATDIPGLDVTHTGLVYRNEDGSLGLIHAAPNSGVKVSHDLQHYVSNVESRIGILVARPTDPRSPISRP
ncbi:N-acetylmuramoyl-L-alanine amidase-like domain-containing protein [Leptothermofonsia sp. ETS-13]|uniref:N-acetylmuramoyl-L-alanine amidase-like domain-containing protein n=1 Tax=Leptothermofonsia sp. ETS-13 TaxID=3035696 RepID=UPI003B9FB62C